MSIYIQSLEASDIFSHITRNTSIKNNYIGMLPDSLEQLKLHREGISTKEKNKIYSNDIINVKFNQKLKSAEQLLSKLVKKLPTAEEIKELRNRLDNEKNSLKQKKIKDRLKYIEKLSSFVDEVKQNVGNANWVEVKQKELRKYLYRNGFTLSYTDKKSGQVVDIKYVVYKRTSSKSRKGQVLFINEALYNEMISWSLMYLQIPKNKKIDYAGLLSYKSLVSSAIEGTIKIDPDSILLVPDVDSVFECDCNVVRKGNDGYLDSFREDDYKIKQSLFDGESILDKSYFTNGKSMMLLRNHMFKSCAFKGDIQQFLKDNCPKGINYDDWIIRGMKAKDIHMITTPSSLKAIKYHDLVGTEAEMFEYWKKIVKHDGCIFGIVKHEKESSCGTTEDGFPLQQTSYQMLNSMPLTEADIQELIKSELDYIDKLKNDDEIFIKYLETESNEVNSNSMFVDLYRRNQEIVNTKIFRDFRKSVINKFVEHLRGGKVRLPGDYCVLAGNILELLYHAIGVDVLSDQYLEHMKLSDNRVYTELYDDNVELVGFRNPHTSPSNVLVSVNIHVPEIKTYFDFGKNIICVNAIKFPIQDILSSCDYDSDTAVFYNHPILVERANECFKKYRVIINGIPGDPKRYVMSNENMFEIDNILSSSQRNIGKIVNIGQLIMSKYWQKFWKDEALLKKIDVITVLSCIAIDSAKRLYDVNINDEIKQLEGFVKDFDKPLFWKYVSKGNVSKNKMKYYRCPMDYLFNAVKPDNADHRENIDLVKLLVNYNIADGDRKQEQAIVKHVSNLSDELNQIEIEYRDEKPEKKYRHQLDIIGECNAKIKRLKIKPETIYSIMVHADKEKYNGIKIKLLNALYSTHREIFLDAFFHKN